MPKKDSLLEMAQVRKGYSMVCGIDEVGRGCGTKSHQAALKKYGRSKIHRKSFNLDKFL